MATLAVLVGGLALGSLATPARSAEDHAHGEELTIVEVKVGLGGKFKVGFWAPVEVTLAGHLHNPSGSLELTTSDSDGVPVLFRGPIKPLRNATASGGNEANAAASAENKTPRYVATGYAKLGRATGDLTVTWRPDGAADDAKPLTQTFSLSKTGAGLPSTQMLVVTVGDSIGLDDVVRLIGPDPEASTHVAIRDSRQLPDEWFGYEGIDNLTLTTSRAELTDSLTDRQFAALDRWVRLGGRLTLTVGRRGEQFFGAESRFQTWSPGRLVEVTPLRRATALEAYAGASQRLDLGTADGGASQLDVTVLAGVRGRIEAPEGASSAAERPLVIRYPLGLGQVTLVTFDLDSPLIAKWQGRTRLLTRLFQRAKDRTLDQAGSDKVGQVTHLGFDDLSGQLRSALDQFSGLTLVSFSWVAVLLVLYIALIGPGDYFLVHYLRRPHWTWVTLGATIVGFTLLAYGLAGRWKEKKLRANQIDVVDVDVESGLARGTSWLNIYSPRTEQFDLTLTPNDEWTKREGGESARGASAGQLLAWQGLPGRGLGGLAAPAAASPFRRAYSVRYGEASSAAGSGGERESAAGGQPALSGLPIQVAATKSLSGRWWMGDLALAKSQLSSDGLGGTLKGEFVNPLPVSLTDWYVVYNNAMYRGDRELGAGDRVAMRDFIATRYLDWQLTRRQVSSEHKDV
ncbi:MAG TPA: hypothetical protein PLV92_10295, partial [Pirellulaceae bacterium]|nr:hypothetical protein [Pirellulaceae bacterium]